MRKLMIFVDGAWLYHSRGRLAEASGSDEFQIDYGKLPRVLAEELSAVLGPPAADIVRSFLFGSYPTNYEGEDADAAARRQDFFTMLRERYHYDVSAFPLDFHGRPLRRIDRAPEDPFEPRETCVGIALASAALFHAAVPHAYDLALLVVGERGYLRLTQCLRQLGKRVAIASIRGNCCAELSDPSDPHGGRDLPVIWLDDHLADLALSFKRRQLRCESSLHLGDTQVWTTYQPRPGEKFYCDACRAEYTRLRRLEIETPMNEFPTEPGESLHGVVKTVFPERGFGFIQGSDGQDYFFHLSDVTGHLQFGDLNDGQSVRFEVKRQPRTDRAGAAQRVTSPMS